jgi:hypothetical protein
MDMTGPREAAANNQMIATKKRQVIGQRLNKPCQYDAVTA